MSERGDARVVLVTGAGRGIGLAIATAFAAAGDRVVLTGRSSAPIEAAAAALRDRGHEAWATVCDVGDAAAARAAVQAALDRWGRIDVLVNNAGVSGDATPVLDLAEADWTALLRVNLTGPLLMAQAAGRAMATLGGGVILNNASIAALGVDGAFAAYSVAKAGLLALTRSMAVELAPLRVRVNAVSPGYTRTEMTTQYFGATAEPFLACDFLRVPQRRMVEPEEVASAFVYLASPGASAITGTNLVVDGGLTANLFIVETIPSEFLTDQNAQGSVDRLRG